LTLERLAETGVSGVTLAVKYMAEVFMQRYGESKHGVTISYSLEKRPMRTGGAIKYAEGLIGHEEPFLVLNGDIFTTLNYSALLKKHEETNAVATIALYRVEDPSRYGTVKLAEKSQITEFIEKAPKEKAPSNLINAGVYVLDPEIFSYIPGGRPVSIEHEVFPKLAKEGKLFGYEFKEIWIDIGKPADYLKANRMLLDAEKETCFLGKDAKVEEGAQIIDPVRIDSGVAVGQNSKIGQYAVIGKDVFLGKNVIVENSVVFPEAAILDSASVRGAIIGEGATIGRNAKIMEGCVIGDYVTINDNINIGRDTTVCPSKEVTESVPESKRIL
jgi:mannose-1-phosphate guanylyltransferase